MWNLKPPRSDSRRFYYYINYQRCSSYTPNSAIEACPLMLSISIFTLTRLFMIPNINSFC